ncbi:MAG TPA: homoserine kinase, partial [Elusimicrobiota bacterium]|nr:homoserine kinase [Elusimicrobiota bacterium]
MKIFPPPSPVFTVKVRVPATSANMGAGFDAVGIALKHYNEVELSAWNSDLMPPVTVQIDGEGAAVLPLDGTNLVCRMVRQVMDRCGRKFKAIRVKLTNRIPLARGLGSSSAAIVGGLVAANVGCGTPFSESEILEMASAQEGHSDNVAPVLLGGVCVCAGVEGKTRYASWKSARLFTGLRAVLCVPYFQLPTQEARGVLPDRVSREDAVFNSSRVGLFFSAFHLRRFELLGDAMDDRIHQPYRKKLVPGLGNVLKAARFAGAWGVALSGSGPSVVALSPVKSARSVAAAMIEAFREKGVAAIPMDLEIDVRGAQV